MALTNYVIMPGEDYQAICDKVRAKTGKTDVIKSGDLATEIDGISGGGGGSSSDERVKYVTFMYGETELLKYPVISGDTCHDPVADGMIDTPTKEQTVSTVYTYSGWALTDGGAASSSALANVTEDRTVYVAFAASARKYTANFYDGSTLKKTEQVGYGSKATPPDTLKDGYDFVGWTPSDLTITGDTDFYGTWEVDQGWLVARVAPTASAKVLRPTYSADGTRLFFAVGAVVYMYDATTQPYTLLTSVTPKSGKSIIDIAVSPNGNWLAVCFTDNSSKSIANSVYVYSVGESSLARRSSVISGTFDGAAYAGSVVFSPDSAKLVVYGGYATFSFYIYTVGGSYSEWVYTSVASPFKKFYVRPVFSPDGTKLALNVENNYYAQSSKLLDVSNGYADVTETYIGTNKNAGSSASTRLAVAYSPDGKYLAFGFDYCSANVSEHQKYNLIVYDTTTTPYTRVLTRTGNKNYSAIYGIAFSEDGSLMAITTGVSPYLMVYDTASWSLKEEPMIPITVGVKDCDFSANNHLVVGSDNSPYLFLYEAKE